MYVKWENKKVNRTDTYITNECFGTKTEVVSVASENEVKVMFVKFYDEGTTTRTSERHKIV
jgi:hypothetical protein